MCPQAFSFIQDFMFGTKYRGKTHELLTQYMLNLGLFHLRPTRTQKVTLLDPMCGRGTTLPLGRSVRMGKGHRTR